MNIYLIQEDGQSFCIKANTMSEAVSICEDSHIDDCINDGTLGSTDAERKYYQDEILQSCSLIGELKN